MTVGSGGEGGDSQRSGGVTVGLVCVFLLLLVFFFFLFFFFFFFLGGGAGRTFRGANGRVSGAVGGGHSSGRTAGRGGWVG